VSPCPDMHWRVFGNEYRSIHNFFIRRVHWNAHSALRSHSLRLM